MSNQKMIDKLNAIIAKNDSPAAVEAAKAQLARLASEGSAMVQLEGAGVESLDPQVKAILEALNSAIGKGYSSADDIRKEINDILKFRKINESDLSDSLKALIQSSRKIEMTVTQLSGNISTTTAPEAFLKLKNTQMLLSDMRARNNSYLYGGAGTGKTFMAEGIAQILGWELITVNCNQYTSPLDILGGQTIEGYQEGRLSMAWQNVVYDSNGLARPVDGVVLLLDELPKIDPNTAGLLNDALAKVKSFRYDPITGAMIAPTIRNGKGQEITLKNLYVVATGNVPLNTIDPDYEANFKQDLSLQDRFIGSTYKVFINFEYELNEIMKGYAFIWIFLSKVRKAIIENRAQSQAFISLRIMINAKETYKVYRDVMEEKKSGQANMITDPKSLIDTMDTLFDLFKDSQREAIMADVNYEEFKLIVKSKDRMPYNTSKSGIPNDFNTPEETLEAQRLIEELKAQQKQA